MGVEKIHIKVDCINASIFNVIREPIFYIFAPILPPGYKTYKEPRIKLFENINKLVVSHITFYLEEDYHKPVDGETISFTCQLIQTKKLNE